MLSIERFDPSIAGKIRYEHFHRYAFVTDYVSDAVVLDIACGQGYGSAVLSSSAKRVVGVDIDAAVIAKANWLYGKPPHLEYVVGDVRKIPFPDNTFDIVVSMETIEHVEDHQKMVDEIRRVLKPDGLLIISSPEKEIYNRYRSEPNVHHIRELNPGDFAELLQGSFANTAFLGQRMAITSLIGPARADEASPNTADYRGFKAELNTEGPPMLGPGVCRLAAPEYLIGLASDAEIPVPTPRDSIFLMRGDDLWEEHSRIMHWASGLHKEDEMLRARLSEVEVALINQEREHKFAMTVAQTELLHELHAAQGREINALSQQSAATDLSVIASILSEIDGDQINSDHQSILRALTRAAVQCATQRLRISDLEARVASQTTEANDIRRLNEAANRAVSMHVEAKEEAAKSEARWRQAATDRDRAIAEAEQALAATVNRARDREAELLSEANALRQAATDRDRAIAEAEQALAAAVNRARDREAELLSEANTLRRTMTDRDQLLLSERKELLRTAYNEQKPAYAADRDLDALSKAYQIVRSEHRRYAIELVWARNTAEIQPRPLKAPAALTITPQKLDAFHSAGFFLADHYALNSGQSDQNAAWKSFCARGCKSGISCNPLLSTAYLHTHVPDFAGQSASFVQVAAPGQYDDVMHPLFDPTYYVEVNGLALSAGESPLSHYLTHGRHRGLSTHPLIDIEWFKAKQPHIENFDLVRYVSDSSWHNLSIHPLFDSEFYLQTNTDVFAAGQNPLEHYVHHGWRENRSPNRLFDNYWYLAANPDVAQSGMVPLVHCSMFGVREHRKIHPIFDVEFYLNTYEDIRALDNQHYSHFLQHGWHEGRFPSSTAAAVVQAYPSWPSTMIVEQFLTGRVDLSALEESLCKNTSKYPWIDLDTADYYLPQNLRNYIIDRFGEENIDLYVGLFSLINRYEHKTEDFDLSLEINQILLQIRSLTENCKFLLPTVSIIIPVHNNLLYTLTCIYSIITTPTRYSFEIIVADDVSSDRTAELVGSIGGCIRHLRHDSNLGFLQNCNAAANIASGRYLVFLNNDTIILPGWLDHLIEPLETDTSVGLTGSKLLNGDGTLQEAGGIFWQDGSAWNFGRNQDPSLPEFNYAKDVDYISGASIALPRELWQSLGGFDPIYTPAYCEDADIAFRVREAGYRTRYQPHSMLVHHEGRSHGRDVTSGIKAYQVVNNAKFLDRWRATLQHHHEPNGEHVFLSRDRSRGKPHIVVIDHYVPQWDRDAGSRTLFLYLQLFIDSGFAVTFWPDNLHEDRDYTPILQQMGVEVIYSAAYVDGFPSWIAKNGEYLNYAFLSRPHIATKYIDHISKFKNIKKIYYGHDLHFRRSILEHSITGNTALLAEAEKWEAIEIRICSNSDVVLYPGFEEVRLVRERVPGSVSVLPLPITIFSEEELDTAEKIIRFGSRPNPYGLMFVGGFSHAPNADGIIWFVHEVMPLLRGIDPRFHLTIAGSNAPDSVRVLEGSDVKVVGRISDAELVALYQTSGLAVVPLRYGAGVKGKVVEAMARGVPVAMTEIGAQGIPNAERVAFVGDTPQTLASAIVAAVTDPDEAARRALQAVAFLRDRYSEHAVYQLMARDIPELVDVSKL